MSEEEKTELSHEPVPGYKTVLGITVIVAVIYLGIVFYRSFF
jgi:hypothetical protein